MSAIAEPPSRRWPMPITWLGLMTVAWALYELTAQPVLGAMALCIKLGWDDFCTAFWLERRDPSPMRGRACFWLYVANGAWKVSLISGLATVIFLLLGELGRDPVQGLNARTLE